MKTIRLLIFSLSIFGFFFMGVNGQETEKKVHLKVIKAGETTVDTVFYASELEDEDLHKKISELAGVDFKMMHKGDISIHASHKESHNFAYVTVDDLEETDGKVKKKIIIKKGEEGEGESEEVIVIRNGEEIHGEGEHYIIEEIDKDHKGHVKIVKVKKGDGDSEEVTVTVITDNEAHMPHDKKGDTDVIVRDVKSGTVIVTKNIEVSKSIGEDGELIEITVVIDEGKKEMKEKKKEKSKETKQKNEKDRNK